MTTWPLRRWLADLIVGDHAYSRNVLVLPNTQPWTTEQWTDRSNFRTRPINGGPAATWEYVGPSLHRNPQETA